MGPEIRYLKISVWEMKMLTLLEIGVATATTATTATTTTATIVTNYHKYFRHYDREVSVDQKEHPPLPTHILQPPRMTLQTLFLECLQQKQDRI